MSGDTIFPYRVMTPIAAANLNQETQGDTHKIVPREIMDGKWKGSFGIPEAVLNDPNHADRRDALLMLELVALDVVEAFPRTDDE